MSSDEAFTKLGNSVNALIDEVSQLETLVGDKKRLNEDYFLTKITDIERALNLCKHSGLTYLEEK